MTIINNTFHPTNPLITLDPGQRPELLKKSIASGFNAFANDTVSEWGLYNGAETYNICGVKEQALMRTIIQNAPNQKEFYALEIGAGNFQWSRALAEYINQQIDLPKGIKVHIIGIRAERNLEDPIVENGCCTIYSLGSFKAEELFDQFKEKKIELENKVDLILSHWCFRHFSDPVGTFVQAYNLLRPKTGFFLVDGFYFSCDKREQCKPSIPHANIQMTRLFLDTLAPFLTKRPSTPKSLNHFILQRPNANACSLPMRYLSLISLKKNDDVSSLCMTQFERISQPNDKVPFNTPTHSIYSNNSDDTDTLIYGNKTMYDWLKINRLLSPPSLTWRPIQYTDNALQVPPLHQSILSDSKITLENWSESNININESDSFGNTPLHLCIQKGNREIFEMLISAKVDFELFNGNGNTAMHEAAIHDKDGYFVKRLIEIGANINAKEDKGQSPIEKAIQANNTHAIEILKEAGAVIHEKETQPPSDLNDFYD